MGNESEKKIKETIMGYIAANPAITEAGISERLIKDSRVRHLVVNIPKETVFDWIHLAREGTDIRQTVVVKKDGRQKTTSSKHMCACGLKYANASNLARHQEGCERLKGQTALETPKNQITVTADQVMDSLKALFRENESLTNENSELKSTIKSHEATNTRLNKEVQTLTERLLEVQNRGSASEITLNTR